MFDTRCCQLTLVQRSDTSKHTNTAFHILDFVVEFLVGGTNSYKVLLQLFDFVFQLFFLLFGLLQSLTIKWSDAHVITIHGIVNLFCLFSAIHLFLVITQHLLGLAELFLSGLVLFFSLG